MMRYDFRPNLLDHGRLLILVRPFFNTSDQDFSFVLQKLLNISHAEILGTNRRILLKFTKGYSIEALEWGCLQMHRRPLGFIGVAKLSADPSQHGKDYEKIVHRFSNLVSQFDSFLYDSRCIIIGPEEPTITIGNKSVLYLSNVANQENNTEFLHFINAFVSSLHVILESKRIDKINENPERMIMPTTPNDKDQTGSESDTRVVKKKCIGRNKKIQGDLCFLAGHYQDSVMYYQQAVESLQNANDLLWVGSALEGLCAVSTTIGLGNEIKKMSKQELVIDNPNINVNVDSITFAKVSPSLPLTNDEIVLKYNECLRHYRRYITGPIEIEAHFKFIRFLIKLKKKLEIAQVVQSLLVLPLTFNDAEKIEFSSVLASIHEQIGLVRKSAFFRHRAALQYKNTNSSKNSLSQALVLLRKICPTYQIDIEHTTDARDIQRGWPAIQLKVLMDILHLSRSLGNKLDSVKLICYILEEHSKDIGLSNQRDLIDWLEEYSDGKEPLHNELNSEIEIQLIKPLPIIKDFYPKKLPHHLEPFKSNNVKRSDNPFIFSSLSTKAKPKDQKAVVWVCGDVSEVVMFVENPLPAEIKVNNMTLITDGIPFEAHPATLALPAESGFIPFMLLGTPKKAGALIIKGYKVAVLGITNTIYLPAPITVEVTPPMPALRLSSTLPRAPSACTLDPEDKNYRTLFTSANLYQGHSCCGKLTLENTGKVSITKLSFKVKNEDSQIIFNEEQATSQLPLLPKESLFLDIELMPQDSWKYCNSKEKIETSLSITYSCQEGETIGYARKIMWVTFIKVMPSLVLYDFNVNEIERHPTCSLICFHAINMTSIPMDVESNIKIENKDIDVPECCRVSFAQVLEPKKKISIQIHYPRMSLPPSEFIMETIESVYQKFITESVYLNWRLSDTNYRGVTYLQSFKVTSETVTKLKPTHISMVVHINDKILKEGDVVNSTIGELVSMTIVLKNCHEQDLENMIIQVNPYQACYRTSELMKELYLPFGSLYKSIKKMAVGGSVSHQCGLLFLYEGEFMVDVSCVVNKQFGIPALSEHKLNTIEMVNGRLPPLSPYTVKAKLKLKESDFWAHTFGVKVQ